MFSPQMHGVQLRNMVNDMDKIVGFVGDKRDEDKKLIPNRLDEADIQGVQESEKALGANGVVGERPYFSTNVCCEKMVSGL